MCTAIAYYTDPRDYDTAATALNKPRGYADTSRYEATTNAECKNEHARGYSYGR